MTRSPTLTQEVVRGLFIYRKDGRLIWRVDRNTSKTKGKTAGWKSPSGWKVGVLGNIYYVKRLVYLYHHGSLPPNIISKNNDPYDTRIENLICVREFNSQVRKAREDGNTKSKTSSTT